MARFPQPIVSWDVPDSRSSVVYLHDHRECVPSRDDPLIVQLLEHRIEVFVPFGGPSWWMDRACPAFDPNVTAERALVEWIAARAKPAAAVGGEAAIRMGLRHHTLLPVVAGWDCAFDFHDLYGHGTSLDSLFDRREQARQHTATLQVRPYDSPQHIWFGCPADSEQYRGNDRLHEKLNAVGVPHVFVVADECPVAELVEFVANGLERRSRRLL